jgi:ribosomal protein L40E
MTNKNKTLIMVIIIVVCLVAAAAITYKKEVNYQEEASKPVGIETIDPNDMLWVKCTNPDCEAEYQTAKRAYFQYLQDNQPAPDQFIKMMTDPNKKSVPGLLCNECSQETVYRAEKCDKCSLVFVRGSVRHDFADRCTGCKYSKTEDLRTKAREAEQQSEQ